METSFHKCDIACVIRNKMYKTSFISEYQQICMETITFVNLF